jgi:hypothetical protein
MLSLVRRRMACIVLVEVHREMGRPSVIDLVRTVQIKGSVDLPLLDFEKTLNAMLDHSSRYKDIEAALGKGICLVLSCYLPEHNPPVTDLSDSLRYGTLL